VRHKTSFLLLKGTNRFAELAREGWKQLKQMYIPDSAATKLKLISCFGTANEGLDVRRVLYNRAGLAHQSLERELSGDVLFYSNIVALVSPEFRIEVNLESKTIQQLSFKVMDDRTK
jgi:hypothetical protein